ncbi:MAG: hypothetical protein AAFW69_10645 [Pseudomonadota bacterium]
MRAGVLAAGLAALPAGGAVAHPGHGDPAEGLIFAAILEAYREQDCVVDLSTEARIASFEARRDQIARSFFARTDVPFPETREALDASYGEITGLLRSYFYITNEDGIDRFPRACEVQ